MILSTAPAKKAPQGKSSNHGLGRPGYGQRWIKVANDYVLIGITIGIIVGAIAGH